jgi:diguanylate cyclase (GGDEF)-like protein
MNFTFLRLHKTLYADILITICLVLTGTLCIGTLKNKSEFDWVDAIGEGGITLMTLIWIFFTLLSRPSGRVTNLLFIGLTLTHVSMLLDFMDEFLYYPADWAWITTVESLPAPLGMIMMTFALYHWHQEQNIINSQLRRTERFYREHSLIDFVTGLYSADYMKNQINIEVTNTQSQHSFFSLMMLDIQQFSKFNLDYGYKHGDILLREIAQLITMNIRDGDLACRYASDRFIVLMPNTLLKTAEEITQQTQNSIENLAYKLDKTSQAIYPKVNTCTHQYRGWHSFDEVLADMNQHLSLAKYPKSKSGINGKLSA